MKGTFVKGDEDTEYSPDEWLELQGHSGKVSGDGELWQMGLEKVMDSWMGWQPGDEEDQKPRGRANGRELSWWAPGSQWWSSSSVQGGEAWVCPGCTCLGFPLSPGREAKALQALGGSCSESTRSCLVTSGDREPSSRTEATSYLLSKTPLNLDKSSYPFFFSFLHLLYITLWFLIILSKGVYF